MGFELEKRLASELTRVADDASHDPDIQRPQHKHVERLKQLAAELKQRLTGADADQASPGKRTEIDGVVASALQQFDAITERARGFHAALPWQQTERATFDDYRAAGLREVLGAVSSRRLRTATVASAEPSIAARAGQPQVKATPATEQGQAMWRVAERRAATLYRHAMDSGEVAGEDPIVDEALERCGSGAPLPLSVRKELEAELGISLARVRVHTDPVAAAAAKAVRAEAFTVGEDIFFGHNAFAPDSREGKKLLAHELTHVVQAYQGRTASGGRGIQVSQPGESLEREADAVAERIDARASRTTRRRRTDNDAEMPRARGSSPKVGAGQVRAAPTIAPAAGSQGATLLRRAAYENQSSARDNEAPRPRTNDPKKRGTKPIRKLMRDFAKERTGREGKRVGLVRNKGAELSATIGNATEGSVDKLKQARSQVRKQGTGKQAKALKKEQKRLGKEHKRDAKRLKKQAEDKKKKKKKKGGEKAARKPLKGDPGPIKFKKVDDWNVYMPPALPDQDDRERKRILKLVKSQVNMDRHDSAVMLNQLRKAQLSQAKQVRGMIPGLVGQIRGGQAAALGRVSSAEATQTSAVQSAVAGQQAAVRAAAARVITQINSAHRAAMTAIRTAKQDAMTKLQEAKEQALSDIDTAETNQLTTINDLYDSCREGFVSVGEATASACSARGDDHPFPDTFSGDKREAARGAARDVASAYAEGMPAEALKAYNENIEPNRAEALTSVRQMATDQRKQVRDAFTQCRQTLTDAAKAATTAANEMKSGAVSQVQSTSSSTVAQLATLGAQSVAGIRQQAAGARSGITNAGNAAVAAVTTGCNKAAKGLEDGAQGLVKGAKKVEAPNPQQTRERVQDGIQQLKQSQRSLAGSMQKQAAGASAGMAQQAQGAADGMAQAANGAKQSAQQMGSGAVQGMTQIGAGTSQGLQTLGTNFKTNANQIATEGKTAMDSSAKALTDAYTEVTNTTRTGLSGAVSDARTSFAGVVSEQEDPAIVENAQKAADAVKPWWQKALAFVVSIVVAIVVVVVVTALIVTTGPVGAILVGAAAGALGSVLGSMASNLVLGNGLMDGITWQTVAMGAVGGALGAGFTQAISAGVGRFGSAGLQSMMRSGGGWQGLALRTGVDSVNELATDAATQLMFTGGYEFSMQNLVSTIATSGLTSTGRYDAVQTRVQGGIQGMTGHIQIGSPNGGGVNLRPSYRGRGEAPVSGANTGDRVADVGDGGGTSTSGGSTSTTGRNGGGTTSTSGGPTTTTGGRGSTSTTGNTTTTGGGNTTTTGGGRGGGDTTTTTGGGRGGGDTTQTGGGRGGGDGDATQQTGGGRNGGDSDTTQQTGGGRNGGDSDTTQQTGGDQTTRPPGDTTQQTDGNTPRPPTADTQQGTRPGADTDTDGGARPPRGDGDRQGGRPRGDDADGDGPRGRGDADQDNQDGDNNDGNNADQDNGNSNESDGPENVVADALDSLGYPNATRPKANEAAATIEAGGKPKTDSVRDTQANQRGLQDLARVDTDTTLTPESKANIRRDVANQMRADEPSGNLKRDVSEARAREQARVEAERARIEAERAKTPNAPTDAAPTADGTTPDGTTPDSTTTPGAQPAPKKPAPAPGDTTPVDPTTRLPRHEGGMAQGQIGTQIRGDIGRLQADWANLTPEARVGRMQEIMDAAADAGGIPHVKLTPIDNLAPGTGGHFDFTGWEVAFPRSMFDADTMQSPDWTADAIRHELRHSEQFFMAARFFRSRGATADQIRANMPGIPDRIVNGAMTDTRPMSDAQMRAAEEYARSVFSPDGNQLRHDILGPEGRPAAIRYERWATQEFLRVANDPNSTPDQIRAAEQQLAEARQLQADYDNAYKNLPEEADAYGTENANLPGRWRRFLNWVTGRPDIALEDGTTAPTSRPAQRGTRQDVWQAPTISETGVARPPGSQPDGTQPDGTQPDGTPPSSTPEVPRQNSTDLDQLYADAAVADLELRTVTNDIASELGGRAVFPPGLKGRERTQQKIDGEYGGDVSRITDLSRSTIEFSNPTDIQRALDLLGTRGEIIRVKDRFAKPADGYRDMLINIRMSNGHVVEVQLHLDAILQAKKAGHHLYEQARVLTPEQLGRPLTPDEQAQRARLVEEMTKLYDDAYNAALAGQPPINPIVSPTDAMPTNGQQTPGNGNQSGTTPDGAAPRPPAPDSLQALLDSTGQTIESIKGQPHMLDSIAHQLLQKRGVTSPTQSQLTNTKYELHQAIENGNWADFRAPVDGQAIKAEDGVNDRLGNIFHEKHIFADSDLTHDRLRLNSHEQSLMQGGFESGVVGNLKAASFINARSRSEGDFSHAYGDGAWDGFLRADALLNNIPKGQLLDQLNVETIQQVNKLIHAPDTGMKATLLRYIAAIGRGFKMDHGGELRTGKQYARPSRYSGEEIANFNQAGVGTRVIGPKGEDGGGYAQLLYPSPDQVRPGLEQLITNLKANLNGPNPDPIGAAAEFQRMFVALHPFGDSNGRTGRVIMNRILAEYDMPPAIFADQNADISLTPDQWRTEVAKGVGRSKLYLQQNGVNSRDNYLGQMGIRAVDASPNNPINLDGRPFDLGTDGLLYDPTGRPWIVKNGEVVPMSQIEHMFFSRRIMQSAEFKPADGSTATRQQGIDTATDRLRTITSETRAFYDQIVANPEAANGVRVRSDVDVRNADAKYKMAPEPEVAEMLAMLTGVDALDPTKIFGIEGGNGYGTPASSAISKHQQMDLEFWYIERSLKQGGYKDLLPQVRQNRQRLFEMARQQLLSNTDPTRVSPENPQGFRYRYEKMMFDNSPLRFDTLDAAIKAMGDKQTTVWRGDYSFAKMMGMAPNNDIRQPDAKKVAEGRADKNQLTNLFDDLVKLEGSAVGKQYICTTSDLALLAKSSFANMTNSQTANLGGLPGPIRERVMNWIDRNGDMTAQQRIDARAAAEKAGAKVLPLADGSQGMELRDAFGVPGTILTVKITNKDAAQVHITATRKAFQMNVDKDSLLPGIYSLGGPMFTSEQEIHGLERVWPWQIKGSHETTTLNEEFPVVTGSTPDGSQTPGSGGN